jgi:hypothetical protein
MTAVASCPSMMELAAGLQRFGPVPVALRIEADADSERRPGQRAVTFWDGGRELVDRSLPRDLRLSVIAERADRNQ